MDRHDIVPAHLAVEAMRDNGYKNAAYALAELMDNAIQAGAQTVELLCGEREVYVDQRSRSRIDQIGILDNGTGMNAATLRMALQFGNGTHLSEEHRTGMGRFGMGLPSSSISQCKKVEVWTWQNGPDSAIYSFLDLESIRQRSQTEIPAPQEKSIPPMWRSIGQSFGGSGTLVVWSKIDRCIWRTAKAIIDNSELLIGRLYRRFLDAKAVQIRMVCFDLDDPVHCDQRFARPNDPGYLMAETSCPEPFSSVPMFDAWGDESRSDHIADVPVSVNGQTHVIRIRYSLAKDDARKPVGGRDPGALPHGKHAAGNVGVSMVRAERELELDQSWVIKYDTTERWWGIEVEFPPSLDELFGVTNNKQSARNFSELAKLDIDALLREKGLKSVDELKAELEADGDPRGPLVEVAQQIKNRLSVLRRQLKAGVKGSRSGQKRHTVPAAEEVATAATRERQLEGFRGKSDDDERLPADERKGIIEETLKEAGISSDTAEQQAFRTVTDGLKYVLTQADLETPAFFSVRPRGGAVIITLNTSHPAYPNLVEVLENEANGSDPALLQTRLANALEGLKLLLMAWARYEDEQPDGLPKSRAQETRVDWGRIARKFLEKET